MTLSLNGRTMTQEEAQQFAQNLIKDQKFSEVAASLNAYLDLQSKNYTVTEARMFDAENFDQEPIAIKRATLLYDGASIELYETTNKEKVTRVDVYADIAIEYDGERIMNRFFVTDYGVKYLTTYKEKDAEAKEVQVELNENSDYVPFEEPSEVENLWFKNATKGCYPGYRHCGAGCGDGMKYGGGTPEDNLDTVCRAHDRCWKNFGSWDSCCDKVFIASSKAVSGDKALKDLIVTIFSSNAAKCPN